MLYKYYRGWNETVIQMLTGEYQDLRNTVIAAGATSFDEEVDVLGDEITQFKKVISCASSAMKIPEDELSTKHTHYSLLLKKKKFRAMREELQGICDTIRLIQVSRNLYPMEDTVLWNKAVFKCHPDCLKHSRVVFQFAPWVAYPLCERLACSTESLEGWTTRLSPEERTQTINQLIFVWKLYGLTDEQEKEWLPRLLPECPHERSKQVSPAPVVDSHDLEDKETPEEEEVLTTGRLPEVHVKETDSDKPKESSNEQVSSAEEVVKTAEDGPVSFVEVKEPTTRGELSGRKNDVENGYDDELQWKKSDPASAVWPSEKAVYEHLVKGASSDSSDQTDEPSLDIDEAELGSRLGRSLWASINGADTDDVVSSGDEKVLLSLLEQYARNGNYHSAYITFSILMGHYGRDFLTLPAWLQMDLSSIMREMETLAEQSGCSEGLMQEIADINTRIHLCEQFQARLQRINSTYISGEDRTEKIHDLQKELKLCLSLWNKTNTDCIDTDLFVNKVKSCFYELQEFVEFYEVPKYTPKPKPKPNPQPSPPVVQVEVVEQPELLDLKMLAGLVNKGKVLSAPLNWYLEVPLQTGQRKRVNIPVGGVPEEYKPYMFLLRLSEGI